jgi:hypothetical protein
MPDQPARIESLNDTKESRGALFTSIVFALNLDQIKEAKLADILKTIDLKSLAIADTGILLDLKRYLEDYIEDGSVSFNCSFAFASKYLKEINQIVGVSDRMFDQLEQIIDYGEEGSRNKLVKLGSRDGTIAA